MKKYSFLILLLLTFSAGAFAQVKSDEEGIREAILNYVGAFYDADTTKAYASIVRDLAKRGYYTHEGQVREAKMSFEQLVKMAQRWRAGRQIGADAPKKITVFDVLDRMASAKVEAVWGIDYFHLARLNGKWMIVNVLWQEYAKKP
jgi:hypothetical protein